MEDFQLENADWYQVLVKRFKPEPEPERPGAATETQPNPDMIVSTRVRPLLAEEKEIGWPKAVFPRKDQPGLLDVIELKRAVRGKPSLRPFNYRADRSYDADATTEEIYEDVIKPLVPWAWGGGIGTLFAYGQTGSGKTFTVSRLEELVIESLMSGDLEGNRNIYLTIIELAGNHAHDLLNSRKQISILEDSFGVTQLAGALEYRVTSASEVMGYIDEAASYRRTATTEKNDASSRSHAICRVRIEIPDIVDAEDGILYLIDLAGSEAARDRAKHGADRMRETREINTSLSILKDCIRGKAEADALAATQSKKKPHVPFRQSALTKVLKHVFDPAGTRMCKTVVMACVNPSLADIYASKNTLRFAEMLRVIVPKAKAVEYEANTPMSWSNEQLRSWIDSQSGSPPVASSVLAPNETGTQLLRLPAPEFELRCMKTDGVTGEQAKAFRSKLWQLHIDSQRTKPAKSKNDSESTESDTILSHLSLRSRDSSRDLDPKATSVPFKQRIRPGMVVSWKPSRNYWVGMYDGMNMVVVLAPVTALGDHVRDVTGAVVNSPDAGDEAHQAKGKSYLCAMVVPGLLPEAYELNMWRHAVVHEDMMDTEVILEYDAATRFYYIAL